MKPTFAPWIQKGKGATVLLCDPTPKHLDTLRAWVAHTPKSFLLECAVAPIDGFVPFYESEQEESGSIAEEHVNRRGAGREVSVASVSLGKLVDAASRYGKVDLVKLDIEGAEFDLLRDLRPLVRDLTRVPQWMIEFHPVPQTNHTMGEVYEICKRFNDIGFRSFSRNGVDFLFWLPIRH